jgi:hypothetical protein
VINKVGDVYEISRALSVEVSKTGFERSCILTKGVVLNVQLASSKFSDRLRSAGADLRATPRAP